MKVGIVHGGCVSPEGSLQPHGKARVLGAINAYKNSLINRIIISGEKEAKCISSYIEKNGIGREKIIEEQLSYSTLSNIFYCRM
ncbi:MAG: YdcF family protein, partial [Candidatus Aenigmarchaeota archaeon]|nr:YdcF family protein [Candidatus Aenigmarchaeota archaeon]